MMLEPKAAQKTTFRKSKLYFFIINIFHNTHYTTERKGGESMNALYGAITGNAKIYGITYKEIGWKLGMSANNVRRLLRERKIKYEDLKIIADYVHLTDAQKLELL